MASIKLFTDLFMLLTILAWPLAKTASPWTPFQRETKRHRNKEICLLHQLWHIDITKDYNYDTVSVITKIDAETTV